MARRQSRRLPAADDGVQEKRLQRRPQPAEGAGFDEDGPRDGRRREIVGALVRGEIDDDQRALIDSECGKEADAAPTLR